MTINSRYTAGRGGRIVYDALVDQIFTAWRYMLCIRATYFWTRHISEKAWDRHKLPLEQKNSKLRLLCNGTIFNDLGRPTHRYTTFLSRDAMLVRYILCDGPVLVCPSVWLGAEGPRDANSCRGTRVATSSSMRPTAADAQQWRGRSIHAAYCYWGYGRSTGWPTYRLCFAFLVFIKLFLPKIIEIQRRLLELQLKCRRFFQRDNGINARILHHNVVLFLILIIIQHTVCFVQFRRISYHFS